MKKYLLTAVAAMLALSVFAGNPLKVIEGKDAMKAVLKDNAAVCVQFDWANGVFDNQQPLTEKFADAYDFIVNDCETSFIEAFNENSKTLSMSKDEAGAKYRFVLTIDNMDSYFAVMRFVPQWEGKMWGNLKVFSVESGETLAVIQITEAEDGADFNINECYGETFGKLGKRIAKMK